MCASDVISLCWKGLKPLLFILKWLLIGIFGLILLPFILAGLGLFLLLKAMGIDVNSEWPIVLILLVCLIALIWFLCHFCKGSMQMDFDGDKLGQIEAIFGAMFDAGVKHPLASFCVQLEMIQLGLVEMQLIVLFILLFLFVLLIQIWFIPFFGGYLVGLILGSLAVSAMSYFAVRYVQRSLFMNLEQVNQGLQHGLDYCIGVGFSLTFLCLCIIYSFFLVCYFVTRCTVIKLIYLTDFLVDELNQEGLKKLNIMLMGFLMGLILGAIVFREIPSILARGIKTATFGLIKTDTSLHMSNVYLSEKTKLAYKIQAQIGGVVVNFLDSILVILLLTCASFALFDHSAEMIEGGNKSIMSPFIYFVVTFFGAIVTFLGFMITTHNYDEETTPGATFTAMNCRTVIILQGIFSILVFGAMPIITIPEGGFSLTGQDTPDIDVENVGLNGVIACGILGLLTNLFVIALFEIYTSHGWPAVQNMSHSSVHRILGMNVIYANYLGGLAGFLPTFTLLIMLFVVFTIGGFAGVIYFAAGYISLILVLMPIYFLGSSSSDSYRLSCFVDFPEVLQNRVIDMSWASRNYMVHLKVTNAGGAVLLSIVMIGCTIYSVGHAVSLFHHGLGAIGLILGAGLAFLLKGLNTCAVINLAKTYDVSKGGQVDEADQNQLQQYVDSKFFEALFYVAMNTLICSLVVLINGGLFGIESVIGLAIGFTLMILLIMMTSITQGTALENARIYNESLADMDKKGPIYSSHVSGEVIGVAVDESNTSPLLVYLLYVIILTYCCSDSMNHDGLIPELVYGSG